MSSRLRLPAEEIWRRVTTFSHVNAELAPFHIAVPRAWRRRTLADVSPGPMFSAWILLFGIIPLDRHNFGLESLGPGYQFQENSSSLVMSRWRHHRSVVPDGGGCIVADRVEFDARLPFVGPLYRRVFGLRHRRLRRWYG